MNVKEIVLEFYTEVYKDNLIRTKNIIGFKNDFFNNVIMTPNFSLSNKISDKELQLHKDKLGRDKYWCNHFLSLGELQLKHKEKDLELQYVVEREVFPFQQYSNFEFTVYSNISSHLKLDYMKSVERNTLGLSLNTLKLINEVIHQSNGKVEYFLSRSPNKIEAGLVMIHSSETSLLINGFVDKEQRGSGLFKEFYGRALGHCFDRGSDNVFYWTFNKKLKNKGYCNEELTTFNI